MKNQIENNKKQDKRKKYTTQNGISLLCDWEEQKDDTTPPPSQYEKNYKIAMRGAKKILPSLIIDHGRDFLDGFAYTSSSAFAGIWNCNTEAHKAGTKLFFMGIALTDKCIPVAIYEDRQAENATVCEIII